MAPRTPDVGLLDDTVAPRILDAMRVASNREDALETPRASGVPVAPLSVLIYLRLKSPRPSRVSVTPGAGGLRP